MKPWRVREARQKAAKERDKRDIAMLKDQLGDMQMELHEWRQWWAKYVERQLDDVLSILVGEDFADLGPWT